MDATTQTGDTREPASGLTTRGRAFVYSYTTLNTYQICPHLFYRRYIKKDLKYVETPQMKHGNAVHAAMEMRIGDGKPLPESMLHWEGLAAPLAERKAQVELKLGVSYEGESQNYWGATYLRGKLDCVLVADERAFMADWKSGRVREDPFELQVGALLLKALHPSLTVIVGTYVWLAENKVGDTHQLSDTDATWRRVQSMTREIEDDRTFEKKQGPICRFCEVRDCEFNRANT